MNSNNNTTPPYDNALGSNTDNFMNNNTFIPVNNYSDKKLDENLNHDDNHNHE